MHIAIGALEDFPTGALRRVTVEGLPPLVVGNADGTMFALKDVCNHGEANLSEGELCGFELSCPLHSGTFDVRSGKAVRRPAKRPQVRFDLDIDDGMVYVQAAEGEVAAGNSEAAAVSHSGEANAHDLICATRREDRR